MNKKDYQKPVVTSFEENINNGVPGALLGAGFMVGRALAKSYKGGIDLHAGYDSPRILQQKKKD